MEPTTDNDRSGGATLRRTGVAGRPRKDSGLFGPDSITWRIHADPLAGMAVLRSLLFQALHPATAPAVVHRDAESPDDVWSRLHHTVEYLNMTTFGSSAEAIVAAARLRAIHARVAGQAFGYHTFPTDDVDLQVWVHCCLVDSLLDVVPRGGLALSPADQDCYVAEQVRSAALIGLEPDEVPHDRGQLNRLLLTVRPELRVTDLARMAALTTVRSESTPPETQGTEGFRPAWATSAGLAFATLPGWARQLYALGELTGSAALEDEAATLALHSIRDELSDSGHAAPRTAERTSRRLV